MKIKQIRAFAIKSDMSGGKAVTPPQRPSWLDSAEVAGPISRFARYKKLRSTWRPNLPAVGCLVIAEGAAAEGCTPNLNRMRQT